MVLMVRVLGMDRAAATAALEVGLEKDRLEEE
jgi:hypothetical protein